MRILTAGTYSLPQVSFHNVPISGFGGVQLVFLYVGLMAVVRMKKLSQNTHLGHQFAPEPPGSVRTEGRDEYPIDHNIKSYYYFPSQYKYTRGIIQCSSTLCMTSSTSNIIASNNQPILNIHSVCLAIRTTAVIDRYAQHETDAYTHPQSKLAAT